MFETPDIQPFLDSLFPGAFSQLLSNVMGLPPILLFGIGGGFVVVVVLSMMAGPKRRRSRKKAGERTRPAPGRVSEESLEPISGRAYVSDGDDVEVGGYSIRLAGIDAPERGQMATSEVGAPIDQGKMAKEALVKKIHGKMVRVTFAKSKRTYGRLIGTVYLDGQDICREMVRKGYAWSAYGEQYRQEEEKAREEKLGIWAHEDAIPPSLFRKNKRRSRK